MSIQRIWELFCLVANWGESWSPWHLRKQIAAYQRHVAFLDDTLAGQQVTLKRAQSAMERYERKERARVQANMDELLDAARGMEKMRGPEREELLADLRRDEGLEGHLGKLMDYVDRSEAS